MEHIVRDSRDLSDLRVTFENNTLTIEVYRTTKKVWKPVWVMTDKEFTYYNISGGPSDEWSKSKGTIWYDLDCSDEVVQEWLNFLATTYPETKWAMKKMITAKETIPSVIRYLKYKDIPETESLIGLQTNSDNWYRCNALTYLNNTWKTMGKANRVKIINLLREKQGEDHDHWWCLKDILKAIQPKDTNIIVRGWDDINIYQSDKTWLEDHADTWNHRYETIDEVIRIYHDWLHMYQNEPRVTDINDPYFRHKKNWLKIHDKIVKRHDWQRRLNGLRIFLNIPEKDYSNGPAIKKFEERYSQWTDRVLDVDGYHIYVSNDIRDWEKRAHALHQCIVSCKYYSNTSCVIVFIDQDTTPIATAQIRLPKNELGQFYGTEADRANCRPNNDVRAALKTYMETYKF